MVWCSFTRPRWFVSPLSCASLYWHVKLELSNYSVDRSIRVHIWQRENIGRYALLMRPPQSGLSWQQLVWHSVWSLSNRGIVPNRVCDELLLQFPGNLGGVSYCLGGKAIEVVLSVLFYGYRSKPACWNYHS